MRNDIIIDNLITAAQNFKENYIDKTYRLSSRAFVKPNYASICCEKKHFLHLTGIKTKLSANDFFDKCICGDISFSDIKNLRTNKSTIVKKVIALLNIDAIIDINMIRVNTELNFEKNHVFGDFALSNSLFTLAFLNFKDAIPISLLKNDYLKDKEMVYQIRAYDKATKKLLYVKKRPEAKYMDVIRTLTSDLSYKFEIVNDKLEIRHNGELLFDLKLKDKEDKEIDASIIKERLKENWNVYIDSKREIKERLREEKEVKVVSAKDIIDGYKKD